MTKRVAWVGGKRAKMRRSKRRESRGGGVRTSGTCTAQIVCGVISHLQFPVAPK